MSYILSAQRQAETAAGAFERYRAYLVANAAHFPSCAHALASSDWYFNPRDRRCPHDAWLDSITISEPSTGERGDQRITTIRLRLLGAYHDGFIELFYPEVFRYSLINPSSVDGAGDWRYDEFRVTPDGRLIHEIEWAGIPVDNGSRWMIEASDVEFRCIPK